GQTGQYVLRATYTDGSSQNVNATSWWILESAATIAQTGVVTGVSAGTAIIHAYYTEAGVTRTAENLSISVAGGAPTVTGLSILGSTNVTVGQTAQYTARVSYSDGSTANFTTGPTWSSSNTSLATITQAGLLTAGGAGSVTVQAVYVGRTATLGVTLNAASRSLVGVSIIGPGSVTVGQTGQYVLRAIYTDGSTQNVNATSWW